jgi:hypothetical protein
MHRSIWAIPINIPGIIPAKNRALTDVLETQAYIIRGILGGMIIPIVEDAPVTATLKGRSYPSSIIAFIIIALAPAVSAVAEPDMPAHIMETSTFTMARPLLTKPISEVTKSTNLLKILVEVMIFAASMKKGTASKGKELIPPISFCPIKDTGICIAPNFKIIQDVAIMA